MITAVVVDVSVSVLVVVVVAVTNSVVTIVSKVVSSTVVCVLVTETWLVAVEVTVAAGVIAIVLVFVMVVVTGRSVVVDALTPAHAQAEENCAGLLRQAEEAEPGTFDGRDVLGLQVVAGYAGAPRASISSEGAVGTTGRGRVDSALRLPNGAEIGCSVVVVISVVVVVTVSVIVFVSVRVSSIKNVELLVTRVEKESVVVTVPIRVVVTGVFVTVIVFWTVDVLSSNEQRPLGVLALNSHLTWGNRRAQKVGTFPLACFSLLPAAIRAICAARRIVSPSRDC